MGNGRFSNHFWRDDLSRAVGRPVTIAERSMRFSGSRARAHRSAICRKNSAIGIRSGDSSDDGAYRRLGCAATGMGGDGRRCRNAASDRQHHHQDTHHCTAGNGAIQNQALGRSRGGFSTKIHARANVSGLPIGLILSPGESHDVTGYDDLMKERDSDPGAMLGDKRYDSDPVRQDLRDRGTAPEIPPSVATRCNIVSMGASMRCASASSFSSTS